MNGDEGLISWTTAEEDKVRQEISDFILNKMDETKNLGPRAVMFEAYMGVLGLASEIGPDVYRDMLKRIGDMNETCVNRYKEQIAQAKEQGKEIPIDWEF